MESKSKGAFDSVLTTTDTNLNLDEQKRKHDKFILRLDAETAMMVTSALVGGFALSLIPSGVDLEKGSACQWIFYLALNITGAFNLLSTVVIGYIVWGGNHVLSITKKEGCGVENDVFRSF